MDDAPRRADLRRQDDIRYAQLERRLETLERKIDRVYDAINEPQQSPLGRQLLDRAVTNAQNIRDLDKRVDVLESWRDEAHGSLNAARAVQIVLAILIGVLAVYQYVHG